MLGLISGILGSTGFGGVIGLLGTGFQHFMHQREEKTKFEHELAMRREDRKDMIQEAELRVKEAQTKIEGEVKIAEMNMLAEENGIEGEAFLASYGNDKATYSVGKVLSGVWQNIANFALTMVDVARGIIRPLITLWGVGVLTYLVILVTGALGGIDALIEQDSTRAWAILGTVVDAIIFIATTSATWWFGSRRMAKKKR